MWTQKKQNKYKAVRQTYQGYSYHSKKEAQKAFELDLLVRAGEIKGWDRQVKFSLDVKGEHVTNYFADFVVEHTDGTKEVVEIKSPITVTPIFKLKWRLLEILFGDTYKLTMEL